MKTVEKLKQTLYAVNAHGEDATSVSYTDLIRTLADTRQELQQEALARIEAVRVIPAYYGRLDGLRSHTLCPIFVFNRVSV